MTYNSNQQQRNGLVSIQDIMNAQQPSNQQPFVMTQQEIANRAFIQGPGYTNSVIFSGPSGTTTYNNPTPYPYGYGGNGGYYQQGGF